MKQRDKMRQLFLGNKGDEDAAIAAYALSEQQGEVVRQRNSRKWDSLTYAKALIRDGKRKGWLNF